MNKTGCPSGKKTMLDPASNPLVNVSYPYYGDSSWDYGFRTQLTGTLSLDASTNSGSVTIEHLIFWGSSCCSRNYQLYRHQY